MLNTSLPSIEQFAAFLDGNLSQNEMQQFSQLAEYDDAFQRILEASSVIDDTIAGFKDDDLQLPSELIGLDFEIPTFPQQEISSPVNLFPESVDEMLLASACAEEETAMSSETSQEEQLTLGDDNHDDTTFIMPNDESLGNSIEDLSNSLSENL